jgi:beta-glucosidase-like glycosyl hydrolase
MYQYVTGPRRLAAAAPVVLARLVPERRDSSTRRSDTRRRARRAGQAIAMAAVAALASVGFAGAATTDPNPGPLELANAELSRTAATEGMVLLENNGALPMATSGNVAIFGVGAYKTVKGGTGSGDVNNRYTITVRQGFESAGYTVTTSNAYWDAMTTAYDDTYGSGGGGIFGPPIDYSSVEQALTPETVQPTAPTDTAIFVVARNSGEGSDRSSGEGDYLLAPVERADIALIGQTYKHVIVVLNTGGIMDTTFFKEINASTTDPDGGQALDSLFLMSQAGQESGNALVEVLNGTVSPSGKLTDTWASAYDYYPASATFANNDGSSSPENYTEGIYVGYRYFDSFYKTLNPSDPASVVNYPFGYGLSYTTFDIKTQQVLADMSKVSVKVKVTNTGNASGKEVVEIYFSAPQTGLDKPYQELAGYGKTDLLAPGGSQVLTIEFDTTQLSSYDAARAAYVMDAGDYLIRVGDSSRATEVVAKLRLGQTTVTEVVGNELTDEAPPSELSSNPADFYTYPDEAHQIQAARVVPLHTKGFTPADDASAFEQNVPVDAGSPYYPYDGNLMSSTTAYVDPGQTNWEGTGAPYAAKPGEQLQNVVTNPATTLYDVAKGDATMQSFVAGLSVTQLANIVEGAGLGGSTLSAVGAAGYSTGIYEDLGIPQMTMSDGPAGLRITQQFTSDGTTYYQFATAWPIGTMLAQTWNRDLLQQVGTAIGKEMVEYGATLWLAPGMNIHRDPLNGRNFEYYSEDPLIAGLTAANTALGVQSNPGVGVTLKHYVANNQETNRNASDSVIGERAAREIYLKGFEIAAKAAQPMAIMTSYNKVNGTYSASNYDMNTDLLRGEWGFKGLVMTDWGGSRDGAPRALYSGNDLIMPGNAPADVVNDIKKVEPTIDLAGLPAYTKQTFQFGSFTFTRYSFQFGGFSLSAGGSETISTTVDETTDLSQTPLSGEIVDGTFVPVAPYGTVDNAYAAVMDLLAGNALNGGQKAAISVENVVHQVAGDDTSPVVAYTVVMKGNYPANYLLRLGDLQRSAMRVLNIAMQSAPFGELASIQGEPGISVHPYSQQFNNLDPVVWVSKDKVR